VDQLDVEPIIEIEGVVERIVFESADTGFVVGRLQVPGAPDLTTFVGPGLPVSPGETVRLRGRWVNDNRWGKQLRVVSFETVLPTSTEGIERYLGSGLVHGIGPAYARRLVQAFGVETLRVIDEQPERLRAVEGIGPKRAAQIRASWAKQRAVQSVMIFLQSHGISTGHATRIYKQYGEQAVAVLRQDPYRLAEDIDGIAFPTADALARKLGLAVDSEARLQAGIRHALRAAQLDGHVFLPEEELLAAAAALLEVSPEALTVPLAILAGRRAVVAEAGAIYLPPMHADEVGAAHRLRLLLRTPHDAPAIHLENALKWVEKNKQIALSEEQKDAIRRAATEKVLVITGGPGTGKTTVINSLLAILEKKGLSFLLAAPTGRAAKRMEEATGRPASTLHRLLEYSPKSNSFSRNDGNPLITDLVVIDESSMLDIHLAHAILKAISPFARLILVGDIDQLPSVGPGSVLSDIIASNTVPVVRLATIFRQAEESGIIRNAHRINTGEFPAFNDRDCFLIERDEPEKALDTIVELVARRIPARFGLDPLRDIQVLTPMRRGECGAIRINEALQAVMNPDGAQAPRRVLRRGDKVMQLRNNYERETFNGDVGTITRMEIEAGELEVTYDDRAVLYAFDEVDELGLAYATTVHKAQGSEYPAIVLAILPQHYMLLQRNLLYTAITRARQLVIVVGSSKAIGTAIRNARTIARHTRLAERLREKTGKPQ